MTVETCCECGGSGKTRINMAFGHVDVDCSFCNGKGEIHRSELYRCLSEAITTHMKDTITENVFKPSPLLALLEKKVNEAQARMAEQLEKTLFAPDKGEPLFRQEYPS